MIKTLPQNATSIKQTPGVILAPFEDGSATYNHENHQYVGLNSTGTSIFNHAHTAVDTMALIQKLMQEYDASEAEIEVDLTEFLNQSQEKGLLSAQNTPAQKTSTQQANSTSPKKKWVKPEVWTMEVTETMGGGSGAFDGLNGS